MIIGSLREKSFNRQAAKYAEELLSGKAVVEYLDYTDIPMMNEDIEFPAPESVARIRSKVMDADGIWIFSPEYNLTIPGTLKNVIDWLSRPLVATDPERKTAIRDKKVAITGVGYRRATIGCRSDLVRLFDFLGAIVANPTIGIVINIEAENPSCLALTDIQKAQLKEQAESFVAFL